MQIIFLCGGMGTRLRAVSKEFPKGLIPIKDKPFFDYILNSISSYKPSSIHFCLGYKSELYIKYIEKLNYPFSISYTCENQNLLLGTGGAIKKAFDFLENDFIVQYGDTILDFDYKKFFDFHLENKKDMTMTILHKSRTNENPNIYCYKNELGDFKCVYNKKTPHQKANFIDYGAIAFKKFLFEREAKVKFDLSELQHSLSINSRSSFFEVFNKYIEIGTPKSFNEALNFLSK